MSTVIASLQYLPRAGHITADDSTDKKKMTVSAPHPWRITEGDNIKVITNHTVRQCPRYRRNLSPVWEGLSFFFFRRGGVSGIFFSSPTMYKGGNLEN